MIPEEILDDEEKSELVTEILNRVSKIVHQHRKAKLKALLEVEQSGKVRLQTINNYRCAINEFSDSLIDFLRSI